MFLEGQVLPRKVSEKYQHHNRADVDRWRKFYLEIEFCLARHLLSEQQLHVQTLKKFHCSLSFVLQSGTSDGIYARNQICDVSQISYEPQNLVLERRDHVYVISKNVAAPRC